MCVCVCVCVFQPLCQKKKRKHFFFLSFSFFTLLQDSFHHSGTHPLKAVPIAVADEEESESEEDELKPRGERAENITHLFVKEGHTPPNCAQIVLHDTTDCPS